MLYEMQCDKCKEKFEVCCALDDHTKIIKPGMQCTCGGTRHQILTVPKIVFGREGFPKNDPRWEHAFDTDDFQVRDKVHLKDIMQEGNMVSRFLEDDV